MSLPVAIPPVLRSWLGWKSAQALNPDSPLVDVELVTLVRRVLYALDFCFPLWTPEFTQQVLDYLYRRCELSTFLYTRVACAGSIGATPPLGTGTPPAILPPTLKVLFFTSTSPLNLLGSSLSGVTLTWSYNRPPATQVVEGQSIDREERELTIGGRVSGSVPLSYSLVATLGTQVVRASTSIQFVNHILVGVGPAGNSLSGLLPLPLKAVESRAVTFSVKAGLTQKVKVAFPLRLGMDPLTPTSPQAIYTVGQFQGGFIESIVSYTNPAGYTEDYVVAESVNVNLGTLRVSLS